LRSEFSESFFAHFTHPLEPFGKKRIYNFLLARIGLDGFLQALLQELAHTKTQDICKPVPGIETVQCRSQHHANDERSKNNDCCFCSSVHSGYGFKR